MAEEKRNGLTSLTPGLLAGKAAVVVGGAGGIGEATSRLLATSGAALAVVDIDGEAAARLAKEIESSDGTAIAIEADLRDEAQVAGAVEQADSGLGGFDILANVAGGLSKHAPLRELKDWDTQTWDAVVHLNLRYVFWTCRAAIPVQQRRGGGSIVNVASVAGQFGSPNQAAYAAAKAALINLTKTLAVELGPSGIRVNVVSPGVTMTAAVEEVMPEEIKSSISGVTPLRRLGRPDDVAKGILFFASPLADFVTGQLIAVEGGVGINFPYPKLHS